MQLQSFKADFKHFRCIFSIFGGEERTEVGTGIKTKNCNPPCH